MNQKRRLIVPGEFKSARKLSSFLKGRPEIAFVSLVGIDFLGNDTDERIPVPYFLNHINEIMDGGVQTDGSSVNLPGIATLNDAKIDFFVDPRGEWFIDENREYPLDQGTYLSTLRIPAFFKHGSDFYCSRSLLKSTSSFVEEAILELVKQDPFFQEEWGFSGERINAVFLTLGTELEFWVRTPAEQVDLEELSLSQMLKESYWKRTKGQVRNALEEALLLLESYGYGVEMGHKEVGGVKAKLDPDGSFHGIMEQLEIDWKYDTPLAAADKELYARILIKETFRRNGLEVTFDAKPIKNVAGSGEHMHFGIGAVTREGESVNLFSSRQPGTFMSRFGYGALMGLLKHWPLVNPFVTSSLDALNRLKPGYEAPVSVVASLGRSPDFPGRNRTVLAGLIRSDNPLSTRFELRAPHPHTNTYLAAAAVYLVMLDGMKYAAKKEIGDLHRELTKKHGEEAGYLEAMREYVSEKNIFTAFSYEERERLYGKTPETVWDIFEAFRKADHTPFEESPMSDEIIASAMTASRNKWVVEIRDKALPHFRRELSSFERLPLKEGKRDKRLWDDIQKKRRMMLKDSPGSLSMAAEIEVLLEREEFHKAALLMASFSALFEEVEETYRLYLKNTMI